MTTPRRHHPRPRILLLLLALAVMLPAVAPAAGGAPAAAHVGCPPAGADCPDPTSHGAGSRHCPDCLPATAAVFPDQRLLPAPCTGRAAPPPDHGGPLPPGHRPPQLRPPCA